MCQQLSGELGGTWNHMNVGDILLRERDNKSSVVSSLIDAYVKEGKMVPSELIVQLLRQAMDESARKDGVRNFIISGFPRSQENIDAWYVHTFSIPT
jgi:UMP-CMP kinase